MLASDGAMKMSDTSVAAASNSSDSPSDMAGASGVVELEDIRGFELGLGFDVRFGAGSGSALVLVRIMATPDPDAGSSGGKGSVSSRRRSQSRKRHRPVRLA